MKFIISSIIPFIIIAYPSFVNSIKHGKNEQMSLNSAEQGAAIDFSLPSGPYFDSCQSCTMVPGHNPKATTALACQCYDAVGSLNPTTFLSNAWACDGCVNNDNGALVCRLPVSSNANGYQSLCSGCGLSGSRLFCITCNGVTPTTPYTLRNACGCQSVSFADNSLICSSTSAPTAPTGTEAPSFPTRSPTPPTWAPTPPTFAPTPPTFAPTPPTFAPTPPTFAPTFPTFAPTLPTRSPTPPTWAPTPPTFAPTFPTFAPTQPTFLPTSPTQPPTFPTFAPTFPTRAPTPPTIAPTSPTFTPTSPTFAPTFPTFAPTQPTKSPTPNAAPTTCESYWLTLSATGEKAPYKPCSNGSFTNSNGCQYQNYCCWEPTSSTDPLTVGTCKVPSSVPVDCPLLTTQSSCNQFSTYCSWNPNYGTSGLCQRRCPGNPVTMCALG